MLLLCLEKKYHVDFHFMTTSVRPLMGVSSSNRLLVDYQMLTLPYLGCLPRECAAVAKNAITNANLLSLDSWIKELIQKFVLLDTARIENSDHLYPKPMGYFSLFLFIK